MLRPAAFVLAVALSAWTLADARRRGLRFYAVVLWTLLTLVAPHIVFPLYLVARLFERRPHVAPSASIAEAPEATGEETEGETATESTAGVSAPHPTWRRALPLLYAALVLLLAALIFLRDYRSVDAHLARAANAKLFVQTERAIREYRAALRLEDDPHTRKLLAVELAARGRTQESLTEFLAAERGGEPDERLPYYIAAALDKLKRHDEAVPYYQKFLNGQLCTRTLPDARCEQARSTVK